MQISEIYPIFTIEDEWGREIEVRARQSLYSRRVTSHIVPGISPENEEAIGRTQFAMLLLQKVEELAGTEKLPDHHDEHFGRTRSQSALDEYFGPKKDRP